MYILRIIIWTLAISISTTGILTAKSGGWMTISQLKNYEKEIRKQKKKFRSITCINEYRGMKRKPRILLKVGIRSNRSNRPWGWAVGRSVLNKGIKFEKAGMRRLALHSSMEPSGYKFQCAVWG